MAKIGIITFHRAMNYGGVLQAYALHSYLNMIGIENEILDYRCKKIEDSYKPIQNTGSIIKNIVRLVAVTPLMYKKNKSFYKFIDRNIKLSRPCYSILDLESIERDYSGFIAGSDQVFTYNWTSFDEAYFLGFTADFRKKNSYAASFGVTSIPESYVKVYKERLGTFNHFSVREESAKIIIQELVGRDPIINIDPTFLITKEDWGKICTDVKFNEYLLLYTLGNGQHVIDVINKAESVAKERNLKIVYINDKYFKVKNNIKYVSAASPEYFVSLFRKASFVVTNSFHGTAFSIIFNKPFLTSSDMPNGLGTRIESLLRLLNLNDRDFTQNDSNCDDSINWIHVNEKIEEERIKAKEYLLRII